MTYIFSSVPLFSSFDLKYKNISSSFISPSSNRPSSYISPHQKSVRNIYPPPQWSHSSVYIVQMYIVHSETLDLCFFDKYSLLRI